MSDISEKAMLSVLNVSQWTARKLDKRVTEKANADHGAASDAGRYNKQLIAKQALADIVTLAGQARTYHYAHTLPWLDDGARILPALAYDDYWRTMDGQRMAFDDAVSKFVDKYPDYVEQAKDQLLGGMFMKLEYPSRDEIKSKFHFSVRLYPMPVTTDFRVAISDAAKASIIANMERDLNDTFNNAVRDVFQRVMDKTGAMVERLSASDAVFRDSLVANVADLIDLLPAFNITGDQRITDLASEMKKLVRYDASALREDKTVRQAVADHAQAIFDKVSGFMS